MGQVLLKAEGLNKRFGNFRALKDLSLFLGEGEILGITGANGSGKTTLINVISGLLAPDGGKIFYREEEIGGLPMEEIVRKGIARTFQIPQIFPDFSVSDCVSLAASYRVRQRGELEGFLTDILITAGIEDYRTLAGNKLSQGCLRRLELARVLAADPEVMLLDEIFSTLSITDKQEIVDILITLNRERGISLVIVSHDIDVIEEICSRAIIMEDGGILYEGEPSRMKRAYRNR